MTKLEFAYQTIATLEAENKSLKAQQANTIAIDKVKISLTRLLYPVCGNNHQTSYNQAIQDAIKAIQSLNH